MSKYIAIFQSREDPDGYDKYIVKIDKSQADLINDLRNSYLFVDEIDVFVREYEEGKYKINTDFTKEVAE